MKNEHSRLRAPRHDDTLRRLDCRRDSRDSREGGQRNRHMHAAPPCTGVPQVPRRSGAQCSGRSRRACRDGQRVEPQDKAHPQLVRQAAALAHALHADIVVMDKSGRALLRAIGRKTDQARNSHVSQGTDRGHRGVHQSTQREPKAAPLDQVSRRYPGDHRALLPPHPRRPRSNWIGTSEIGTLATSIPSFTTATAPFSSPRRQ